MNKNSEYLMNGYDLSRNWFDFCFDNPEKINPNHTAIYFFAIEHCNRLGWKKKFGFPSQMTMDALGIKKHQTYIKYFNDLVDWKFFDLIQKSKNQYSANIISLISAMPKNGEALDKAIIKHAAKQTQSNGQSNSPIVKPVNKETKKLTTEEQELINYLNEKTGKQFRTAKGEWLNNVDITHLLHPFALPQFSLHQHDDGRLTLKMPLIENADEVRQLLNDKLDCPVEFQQIEDTSGEHKMVQYSSDLNGDQIA